MKGNARCRPRLLPTLATVLVLCCTVSSVLLSSAYAQSAQENQNSITGQKNDTDAANPELMGVLRDKVVTITSDETYMSISKREFNTVGLWRLIAEYNQLNVNNPLFKGQQLKIPLIYYRPREFAEVIYAHGENKIVPSDGSDKRDLKREDKIYLNDAVETGDTGFVSVQFRTGAVINVQPSSSVKLIKLGCLETDPKCFIELNSEKGELSADVPKTDEQENVFRIHTPHTSAAVRGTRFDFTSTESDLVVGVTNGEVALISNASEVDLPLGFGVKAAQDTPFGNPIPLLPATNMRAIAPRVAETDLISAVEIDGATGYIWRLTSDETGNEVLDKASGNQPLYTVGGTAAGEYFLTIRAVDPDGIKGFSKFARINVADIDDSFDTVVLASERDNQDLTIKVDEIDKDLNGYEVQLSLDDKFADAVSVDISNAGVVIFAQQPGPVYVRARGLIEPLLVTPFGPTLLVE